MVVRCPHCGESYECDVSTFGRYIECGNCHKNFVAGQVAQESQYMRGPVIIAVGVVVAAIVISLGLTMHGYFGCECRYQCVTKDGYVNMVFDKRSGKVYNVFWSKTDNAQIDMVTDYVDGVKKIRKVKKNEE